MSSLRDFRKISPCRCWCFPPATSKAITIGNINLYFRLYKRKNMKNILSLLMSLAALLSTAAFQVNQNNAVLKSRIRQTTDLMIGNPVTYTYNPDGRIALIKGKTISISYEYKGNLIMRKTSNSSGHLIMRDSLILDNKGLVVNRFDDCGQNTSIYFKLDYDTAGYLTARSPISQSKAAILEEFKYSQGNQVRMIQNDSKSKPNIIYYSYYPDRSNTIGDDNMGMAFNGHSSRNALKDVMNIRTKGDTLRTTYYYHYDAQGRIITRAGYYKSKLTDSTGYSYY